MKNRKTKLIIFLAAIIFTVSAFTGCGLFGDTGITAEQRAQLDKISVMEDQLAKLLASGESAASERIGELEAIIGELREQLIDAGVETTAGVIGDVVDSVVAIQAVWLNSKGKSAGVATGTGFYIEQGGYIATNSHVITPDSGYTIGTIYIYMYNGTETTATIIADLPEIDVAILKSEISTVKAVTIDSGYVDASKAPALGNKVIAIGTPVDLDLKFTCTSGIISGLDRIGYTDTVYHQFAVQHDAAINPGNSGGPLFNMAGHVIGINSFGMLDYESLGFAIDSLYIYRIQQGIGRSLLKGQAYKLPSVNITVTDKILDSMKTSTYAYTAYTGNNVKIISAETNAYGLAKGNIITAINGKEIKTRQDYYNAVLSKDSGESLTFTVKTSSASTATKNITVVV